MWKLGNMILGEYLVQALEDISKKCFYSYWVIRGCSWQYRTCIPPLSDIL